MGLPLVAYKIASKLLPTHPVPLRLWFGPLRGHKVCANYGLRPNYLFGGYEAKVAGILLDYVQPGQVAYDIGANIGYMSMIMALKAGEKGKVYSFEPAPNAYGMLEANSHLNRDILFEPKRVAIADKVGKETFSFFDYDVVSRLGDHSGEYSDAQVIDVEVFTLDHYINVAGIPKPDFLKIDVEGAEMRVLSGMTEVITEKHPTMLIEVHSPELSVEVVPFCEEHGYNCEIVAEEFPQHVLCTAAPARNNTEP
jgi:FkbM family methyltransferase